MKKAIIIFIFFSFNSSLDAQFKHDYIWMFGYNDNGSTIDFNTNPASIYFENRTMDIESNNAIICDNNGGLLFYTNGCYIADATHEIMLNGDSLNPGYIYDNFCNMGYPWAQNSLILPQPENDSIYFLFHKRGMFNASSQNIYMDKLFYSIVNMKRNNNYGEVIIKNEIIVNDTLSFGGLTSVKHSNGIDWWIIIPEYLSNRYNKFLFTKDGIESNSSQIIGVEFTEFGEGGGQDLFSPNGQKYIRFNPTDGIFIFDFDRLSGSLSNFLKISIPLEGLFGGAAISPNSRFLYVSAYNKIFQFDLSASDIESSETTVATYDGFLSPFPTNFYQMQLAPDCRIYINSTNGVDVLHVINQPNEPGLACDVQQHAIQLPTFHHASLPNFPMYRLGTDYAICDSTYIVGVEEPALIDNQMKFNVFPNPANQQLNLEYSIDEATALVLEIKTLLGQNILQVALDSQSNQTTIDISDIPVGVYFVRIRSEEKNYFEEKIVVVR